MFIYIEFSQQADGFNSYRYRWFLRLPQQPATGIWLGVVYFTELNYHFCPNTFFKRSVVRAARLVRIFTFPFATQVNRASVALLVTKEGASGWSFWGQVGKLLYLFTTVAIIFGGFHFIQWWFWSRAGMRPVSFSVVFPWKMVALDRAVFTSPIASRRVMFSPYPQISVWHNRPHPAPGWPKWFLSTRLLEPEAVQGVFYFQHPAAIKFYRGHL